MRRISKRLNRKQVQKLRELHKILDAKPTRYRGHLGINIFGIHS